MSGGGDRDKVPLEVPKDQAAETDAEREARLERERKTGKDELIQRQNAALTKPTETTKDDLQKKEDLSEEDRKLKENLEMLVQRVVEPGNAAELRLAALTALSTEIRSSTSSMTALPKPLKFLRQHYDTVRAFYDNPDSAPVRPALADVLSVLAMVNGKPAKRETLKFRLLGSQGDVGAWGHEYVRHVATELAREFDAAMQLEPHGDTLPLVSLLATIVPFFMKHNAEVDACDLLMEVDMLNRILDHVSVDNVVRVCSYVIACSDLAADEEERMKLLDVVYQAYLKVAYYPDALRVAIRMHNTEYINATIAAAKDPLVKKQLAYILGSQRIIAGEFEDEALKDTMGNTHMHAKFVELARDLGVTEPKSLDDVYKTHLAESGATRRQRNPQTQRLDSAKQNLAGTFVNAFVNLGYGKDSLLTQENSDWLYKNKDHGMMSAAASLGAIMLWDMDTGFSSIDKYSFSTNPFIKAGSLLATGMISCGVTSELDAGFALLSEHVEDRKDTNVAVAAAFGLGLGYAGKERPELYELLVPVVVDNTRPFEVSAIAALSLGLIFAGSANDEVCTAIVESFADRSEKELADPMARLMCLAIGLLFIGHPERVETTSMVITASIQNEALRKYADVTLTTCAYFGSGTVDVVQKLLNMCGERAEETKEEKEAKEKAAAEAAGPAAAPMVAPGAVPTPVGAAAPAAAPAAGAAGAAGAAAAPAANETKEQKDAREAKEAKDAEEEEYKHLHLAMACVGVTGVASGEEIGSQMAHRSIDNMMQYCDIHVRRGIPIALALSSVSHPRMTVIDTLSKLSHDSDEQISQNAIFALGLVGAGTNNSRIANLLRQLAVYYAKDANHLFISRIAQGLLHLGKGLLTLDPFHSENLLSSPISVAGLLILAHCALDMKNTILSHRHYLLFSVIPAVRPRALMTVDEDGKPLAVKVRVGQSVDTVGQAGKPKSITGFQTHDTPILINKGDRAELDNDEYIPLSNVLEGIVIMKKNPNATKN